MTIYCENASAAEVIFSLTGGREGRIVSYDPPVEIERAQGVVAVGAFLNSENLKVIRIIKTFFAKTIVNGAIGAGTWFSAESDNYRYYQSTLKSFESGTKERFKFSEVDKQTNIEKIFFDIKYFISNREFSTAYPIKAFKNAFIISDTTGILYAHDYGDIPVNYEVICLSCPVGEIGIKGEGGNIKCIDAARVISGVNRANSKLQKIYGDR